MNKPLLRKIAKLILKNPRKYDQNDGCGTACCIGGHAVALAEPKVWREWLASIRQTGCIPYTVSDVCTGSWPEHVKTILQLTEKQYSRLCCMSRDWPHKFERAYYAARTAKEKAKVGHDRIMHFIKTGR